MVIKIVKLFHVLLNDEPRLGRKLVEPLSSIIKNTSAKSLLWECISTLTKVLVISSLESKECVYLCSNKLLELINESDSNLKYLGLVGFINLCKLDKSVIVNSKELILSCLNEDDFAIRVKALYLLAGKRKKERKKERKN